MPGARLGDEIALAREQLGWSHAPFRNSADIRDSWNASDKGKQRKLNGMLFERYAAEHPYPAAEFKRRTANELPADWEAKTSTYIKDLGPRARLSPAVKPRKTPSTLSGPCCLSCWAVPLTSPVPT